ncbi:CU044_5270 family protein [Streptomyces luteireticuli]|uniref:CU044_5270 family protein n=1 Tax=Streptomyces luteireticuli TaxID=173858 RepID=UPI0035584520
MTTTPRRRPFRRSRPDGSELPGPGDLLPPPPVPGLDPGRERLLKDALLREAARTGPADGRTARAALPRRPLLRIAVPAVVCALAAGGVVAANLTDPPARGRGTIADGVPREAPEAVRLLDRIALAAARERQQAVGSGQFVYIESKVAYAAQSAAGGPATVPPAHRRQVWLSADGSRPGLLREAGGPDTPLGADAPVYTLDRPGATPKRVSPRAEGPSVVDPTPAYVASLPTDPDALLRLIRKETRGRGQDPDQQAFTTIGDLLAESWAPPRVAAALYRAAAKIPGVTVVRTAVDAAGREGVAVARTARGQQTQWIFDRSTHAFLGERTVLTASGGAGPAGTVVGSSAVLTRAAVDRAGELPRR